MHNNMKTTNELLLEKVQNLDKQTSSPKDIAKARKYHLGGNKNNGTKNEESASSSIGLGFPTVVVTLLRQVVNEWLQILSSTKDYHVGDDEDGGANTSYSSNPRLHKSSLLEQRIESVSIKLILSVLLRITQMDSTFDEELAKEGSHIMLSKIINIDVNEIFTTTTTTSSEANEDFVIAL